MRLVVFLFRVITVSGAARGAGLMNKCSRLLTRTRIVRSQPDSEPDSDGGPGAPSQTRPHWQAGALGAQGAVVLVGGRLVPVARCRLLPPSGSGSDPVRVGDAAAAEVENLVNRLGALRLSIWCLWGVP